MQVKTKRPGRVQLLLIAAVFLGPLLLASWMYFSGGLNPDGSSNHGDLLEPIINVPAELPDAPVVDLIGERWLMVYANAAGCVDDCPETLHRLRQFRLMLGKDMNRVDRVFVHSQESVLLIQAASDTDLAVLHDGGLIRLLEQKQPPTSAAGGIFLIDPLGNLVMYFAPEIEPRDVLDDIEHLLRLSRIG